MTILLMQVRPFGLSPVSGWDADQQAKYPQGSLVHVNIAKGRSAKMLRFYWGLVDMVAQATNYDKESLSDELLIRTGRVDTLNFINGEIRATPKRISKMKHEPFKTYVDAAVELICREYLAQMTRSKLLLEVEKMLGISYEDAFKAPPTRRKKEDGRDASNAGVDFQSEGSQERQTSQL